MNYKLTFIGFGNVAQALIHLLERKRATFKGSIRHHIFRDRHRHRQTRIRGQSKWTRYREGIVTDQIRSIGCKFFVNAREQFVVGHQRIQSGCNV